jgi:hypothetical protein
MKTQPKEGYWFSDRRGVLPHGDWRPFEIGVKLSVKGRLVICKNALHGSFDPFDAMQYAPGPILHRVLFSGARIEESDKVGSRSRTILATRDAETMLYAFARKQALLVADMEDMPPVVRQYLETGDATLRTAARTATRNEDRTARSAAEHAAWAAAWGAARSVAEGAARSAVDGAARSVAWGAARSACSEVWSEVRSAAEGAAWTAAWTAADNAARVMFNQMVMDLFGAIMEDHGLLHGFTYLTRN